MVKKGVPMQLWDYDVSWVSEVMSMTHSSSNSVNVGILLTNVTSKTVDISEYLDFFFYEKLCFKDNTGLYLIEPVSWLGISHQTGRLMCCHIRTQAGKFKSRSMVHQVTNIELSTDEFKKSL